MTNWLTYRFHRGLRFRIGALFGGAFLLCLAIFGFFLYRLLTSRLEQSFRKQLESAADVVLARTETSPLIVPLPDSSEHFLLTYKQAQKQDTLFNNLAPNQTTNSEWRLIQRSRLLESGASLYITYAQKASELNAALARVRQLLFLYFPCALLLAFTAAYFLSGFLLRPIRHIISRARGISLEDNSPLLGEPGTGDELHELTVTLNDMLRRIRRQAQEQNAFFAAASHELRTPLSNMLTELQVLPPDQLSPIANKLVQSQIAEVQRLKKLVNDFLLMSQLKTGRLPFAKQNFSLLELCAEAAEQWNAKALARNNTLLLQALPEEADFTVTADRGHIGLITGNLLENAIKFSPQNTIIRIGLKERDGHVELRVTNNTASDISVENLGQEFVRGQASVEGFGLGLWLSRQLAQINDSALNFHSTNNTFEAVLTVRQP